MRTDACQLILWTSSDSWASLFRRKQLPYKVTFALDFGDLLNEARRVPGSLAIVELNSESVEEHCKRFAKLCNNPYDLAFLAVGDCQLLRCKTAIRAVGFRELFWTTSQVNKIEEWVRQYFQTIPADTFTLEERLELGLPWKPVRLDN